MATVEELERERLEAQVRLDSQKGAEERNRMGQFATPPRLAVDIATYVREHWQSRKDPVRFLDPALGTGSFYSALRLVFPASQIRAGTGFEIDAPFAAMAAKLWRSIGLEVLCGDFTKQAPPSAEERFNLVLTNPPYVRHHHLAAEEKERLGSMVARDLGIGLSGLAGLYCYFLLLSDRWLADGGLAVWLMPSEFMDVNYGKAVKQYLTRHVRLLRIHRFCPADVQFSDALVSSAIVIFEKSVPSPGHAVDFSLGGSLLEPQLRQSMSLSLLKRARKWTNYPRQEADGDHLRSPEITLAELFTIKRGLATGANDFFILPRDEAARWEIPEPYLKPILPSPRHLPLQVIDSNADGYPSVSPALALIDCDRPEEEIQRMFPTFWSYLLTGKEKRVHETYIASRRCPWYSQEKREPPPFLCTYMGRRSNGRKPFRFLWNKSRAVASNLYLLLYPRGAFRDALETDPQLYAAVFAALQEIDAEKFIREGRVYGGGLYKMEPKELGHVPADRVFKLMRGTGVMRQKVLFEGG